jgi:hypothetical protein
MQGAENPPKTFEEVCSRYINMAKEEDFEADMNVVRHILFHYIEDELEFKLIDSNVVDFSMTTIARGKGLGQLVKILSLLLPGSNFRPFLDL